jgi:hypothetical protein
MDWDRFVGFLPRRIACTEPLASSLFWGAFLVDARSRGPHWYCCLDEFRRDYADWLDGYTGPKTDRYFDGLRAEYPFHAG